MKKLALMIIPVLLIGCGGGGSSSGGGGGTPASFAGTYNGFSTATISAPGLAPDTITGTIQIVIDAQGNVTSDPNTAFSGTGTLNGSAVTVTVPAATFNQPGVACAGVIVITGTISGNTITGTISARGLTCNGIPFQINGTFEVTRLPAAANVAPPAGATVMESLSDALR